MMDIDPNLSIPVEISHYSGAKFRIYLTAAEIERFNTDTEYQEHLVNKYYDLHKDGLVSAYFEEEEEEEMQDNEASSQISESLPSTSGASRAFESLPGTSGTNRPRQSNLPNTSSGSRRPRQWNVDDEETLIQLVSERPPLFDFRLPLIERSRAIVKNLWEEVILGLNVDLTVEAVKGKWKNIRDSYMRVRININKKLASGSSAQEKIIAEKLRKNHKHYELLTFLDNTLITRRTTSNLEESNLDEPEPEMRSPPFSPTQTEPRSRSASRSTSRTQGQTVSNQDEVFLNTLRDIVPRALTPTQSFCLRLADGMDKLPPRVRNQVQVEFLNRLTELENLHVYTD